jgi:hypothetical protein
VDAAIAACSLDLTEAEYARLMQAAAGPPPRGASWAQARAVLLRIGRELTTLSRPTLDTIAAFFATPQAWGAFSPEGAGGAGGQGPGGRGGGGGQRCWLVAGVAAV